MFAAKPRLVMAMLEHALTGGLAPRWVLAEEVYGSDSKFRRFLGLGTSRMCWR